MTTLYVSQPGAWVRRTGRRLVVGTAEGAQETVRLRDLERVVLVGNTQLTGAALGALLDAGVETVLLSSTGRLRGRLAPAEGKNVFIRQAQFQRQQDPEYRLRMARVLVEGKIRNSRALLQQHSWDHPEAELAEALDRLEAIRQRVESQETLAALLGTEGEAAQTYFGVLGRLIHSDLCFGGRSRRPPRDPVNAALSFGYTLVLGELVGAVAAAGLDPQVGLLHELDYGRPSLALDLLEEFRQPLVDRLVLSLVNRQVLRKEHFEGRDHGGVFLNDAGRPRFLDFYHRAVTAEFHDRASGEQTCFRRLLRRQAARMRQAVTEGTEYRPVSWR